MAISPKKSPFSSTARVVSRRFTFFLMATRARLDDVRIVTVVPFVEEDLPVVEVRQELGEDGFFLGSHPGPLGPGSLLKKPIRRGQGQVQRAFSSCSSDRAPAGRGLPWTARKARQGRRRPPGRRASAYGASRERATPAAQAPAGVTSRGLVPHVPGNTSGALARPARRQDVRAPSQPTRSQRRAAVRKPSPPGLARSARERGDAACGQDPGRRCRRSRASATPATRQSEAGPDTAKGSRWAARSRDARHEVDHHAEEVAVVQRHRKRGGREGPMAASKLASSTDVGAPVPHGTRGEHERGRVI